MEEKKRTEVLCASVRMYREEKYSFTYINHVDSHKYTHKHVFSTNVLQTRAFESSNALAVCFDFVSLFRCSFFRVRVCVLLQYIVVVLVLTVRTSHSARV